MSRVRNLTLTSNVHISVSLGSGAISKVQPDIALYLPAALLETMQRLTSELQGQVSHLAMDTHIYKKNWDAIKVTEFLESQIQRRIQNDTATAFWIEAQGQPGNLQLTPNLKNIDTSTPKYKNINIHFQIQEKTHTLEVPLAEAANLVSRLCKGNYSTPEAETSPSYLQLIEFLKNHQGLLATPENKFLPPVDLMHRPVITSMGHAFLILDYKQKRYLFDPWLFQKRANSSKPQVAMGDLGSIDGVFITHHHPDHFDIGTLLQLSPATPIYLPKEQDQWHEPKCAKFLRDIGFKNVNELVSGKILDLENNLSIHSLPFYGEGRNILKFAAQCLMIQTPDYKALLHADAAPDSTGQSMLNDGTLAEFVKVHGSIDDIFATWWQLKVFLFQLDPLALFTEGVSSKDWLTVNELCDCPTEFLTELIHTTKAKRMVFYAENGSENFLPPEKRSSFLSTVSYFWRSQQQVIQEIQKLTKAEVINIKPWSSL